ncbi:MAG: 4-phosphoerythronate dehydrogenase PdxB [Bacteroidota bacterium]|nr:4-phosphoerythronate dehydrogenase PdxB [Bacteroidota bacterium]
MKIVVDNKIPFLKGVLEPFADVVYLPGNEIAREHLMDAEALIIRTRTRCNEALLTGTNVKFIATATIGFDHIDTDWCEKNGIRWTNAPGCNSGSVYQYVASVLVNLAEKHGFDFADRSLGIIGVGNVGRKIVKLGEWLGMRVLLNDPPRSRKDGPCGYVSLEGIIRECDIITCHVPLNMEGQDKTYHLFDEKLLRKLHPNTILINSSRGEVVDNQALKAVMNEKKITAAVLDVWENEPSIDTELLGMLDIVTPHIAGYSADGKANGTSMSVQFLSKFFNLPLTRWFAEDIPLPDQTSITIDCHGKSVQQVLSEAILFTYDVMRDDRLLRSSVETFEKQRGNYPLRREFCAYELTLLNAHSNIPRLLTGLGFKVK